MQRSAIFAQEQVYAAHSPTPLYRPPVEQQASHGIPEISFAGVLCFVSAKALKAGNGRWDAQVKEFVHVAALPPAKQETRPRSVSDTVSGTVSSSSSSIPLVLATRPDTASMLVNNSKAQIVRFSCSILFALEIAR